MTRSSSSPTTRLVDWLIDRDSSTWGDEAERLRYYEAHSATLQLIVMVQPLVAAGAILWQGRGVIPAVVALWLVPLWLLWFAVRYLEAKRVRVWELAMADRRRGTVRALPNIAPLLAIAWANRHHGSSMSWGMLTGAVVGGVIGWAAIRSRARRDRDAGTHA